jgi:hypothetical protein
MRTVAFTYQPGFPVHEIVVAYLIDLTTCDLPCRSTADDRLISGSGLRCPTLGPTSLLAAPFLPILGMMPVSVAHRDTTENSGHGDPEQAVMSVTPRPDNHGHDHRLTLHPHGQMTVKRSRGQIPKMEICPLSCHNIVGTTGFEPARPLDPQSPCRIIRIGTSVQHDRSPEQAHATPVDWSQVRWAGARLMRESAAGAKVLLLLRRRRPSMTAVMRDLM